MDNENGYNVYGIYQGAISPMVNTFQANQGLVSNIVSDPVTPDSIVDGQISSNLQQSAGTIFANKQSFADTIGGYRLGFDIDGIAKFLIGNSTNSLYWNGSTLVINGSITATTGTIGGFTIEATDLTSVSGGNTTLVSSGPIAFSVGPTGSPTFTVTQAGVMTATSGTIGGWTIGSTSLTDTAGLVGMSSAVTGGDDIRFFAGNATPASAPFRVTESGSLFASNATISGAITATSGTIGGFTISSNSLTAGSSTSKIALDTTSGIYLGDDTFAGAPFSVSLGGSLSATSGVIGGFTIGATALYGGVIKTGITVGMGSTGVIMDTNGLRGYDAVLGNTFNLPTDGSAPSFSSGIINSTIFEVDTSAIIRTSDTVGDGTSSSAGILINDTGLYACEANQLLANANVKILTDGTATFNASVRGGQTDFNTGTGYFLGLSGGDYKFSIGSPASNYMTWDGTFLKLKGSFDVGVGGLINNASYTVANLPVAPTSIGFNVPSAFE